MNAQDPRFSAGLIVAVFAVLHAHGYRRPGGPHSDRRYDRATGAAVAALAGLVRAFEGHDDSGTGRMVRPGEQGPP